MREEVSVRELYEYTHRSEGRLTSVGLIQVHEGINESVRQFSFFSKDTMDVVNEEAKTACEAAREGVNPFTEGYQGSVIPVKTGTQAQPTVYVMQMVTTTADPVVGHL